MSSESSKNNLSALLLFSVIPIVYCIQQSTTGRKSLLSRESKTSKRESLSLHFPGIYSNHGKIRPPFPPVIREMLSSCRLAYLSTVQENSSHLSLMRFTYINDDDDGEVIIMTTRRETKKFNMLKEQNGVALLIHDFSQFENDEGPNSEGGGRQGVHSITLNGKCEILDEDNTSDKAKRYRTEHLQHNPDYPQFIVGPDISVLLITITSARICNINDQVTKWDAKDN